MPVNFEDIPTKPRVHLPHMPLPEREHNFKEVEATIGQAEAMAEAARCLSCGCLDVLDCRLRSYADTYQCRYRQAPGLDSKEISPANRASFY